MNGCGSPLSSTSGGAPIATVTSCRRVLTNGCSSRSRRRLGTWKAAGASRAKAEWYEEPEPGHVVQVDVKFIGRHASSRSGWAKWWPMPRVLSMCFCTLATSAGRLAGGARRLRGATPRPSPRMPRYKGIRQSPVSEYIRAGCITAPGMLPKPHGPPVFLNSAQAATSTSYLAGSKAAESLDPGPVPAGETLRTHEMPGKRLAQPGRVPTEIALRR